jgi:GGDEF domain-containing protein
VAALGLESFQPFLPAKVYAVGRDRPLWLKLRVFAPQAMENSGWLLEFPTVIVDRYEVFQRGVNGQWQMAAAGDRVAHSQWPVDSLRPRFPLRASVSGEQDVFVRVLHQLPVNLQPVMVQASDATRRDSMQMLWTGLLLGVVVTLVLTCAQMTLAYRDSTYGWYAGYLLFTVLAALCYSGIAQRNLWPGATKFSSDAIVYAVMAALAFNLEFSRAMFGALQSRASRLTSRMLVALCAGYCLMTFLSQRYDQLITGFHFLTLSVFSFTIFAAVRAWRRGVIFGGYWLLIYVPYLCCIALTLAHSAGLISAPWLPAETPVAAAIAEAVAMMLCINAYGRLRHAQSVREQVAARYDPLTGFLKPAAFRDKAARLWNGAVRSGPDMAVVYVTVDASASDSSAGTDMEVLMARSVRLVRTIARDFDIVGRLGRNRIGIVMTGVPPREALSGRLARLVALGLMQDSHDPAAVVVRFRLGVGLRRSFAGDFSALDSALQELLNKDDGTPRVIRFLDAPIPTYRVEVPELA